MKSSIITLTLCLGVLTVCNGQKIGIDSDGKSIFTHIAVSDVRFELSTEEPASISYFKKTSRTDYVLTKRSHEEKEKSVVTVSRFKGLFGQFTLLNSTEPLMLSNLSEMKLGYGFKLGYQCTIDTFRNIDDIPTPYIGTYTYGLHAIYNIDNFILYNPESELRSHERPTSLGLEGNFNFFFKNWNKNSSKRIAIALTGTIERTWNNEDLLNFQDMSKSTVLANIVVLEDFEGRYGVLKDDVIKMRFSAAVPMYFGRFNPIPYVVYKDSDISNAKYHLGVFTNILNKKLTKSNFRIPSSFGLGVDSVYSDGDFSGLNVLIKGAISFGKV
jgi:hypothetical protein